MSMLSLMICSNEANRKTLSCSKATNDNKRNLLKELRRKVSDNVVVLKKSKLNVEDFHDNDEDPQNIIQEVYCFRVDVLVKIFLKNLLIKKVHKEIKEKIKGMESKAENISDENRELYLKIQKQR